VQKPGLLTTLGRPNYTNYIYLNIKDLTPPTDGHFVWAKGGQDRWLFHFIMNPYPAINSSKIFLLVIVSVESVTLTVTENGDIKESLLPNELRRIPLKEKI
jgi:hypothetical protein